MDLSAAEQAARDQAGPPSGRLGVVDRAFVRATALTGAGAVVIGVVGTFGTRRWGEVPFSVPAPPWYLSWPYYIFWSPRLDLAWAVVALPVACLAAAAALALARAALPRPLQLAGWAGCTVVLALAVAALAGGPDAWRAPLAYPGEYPDAVDQVGAIPTFLGEFAARVPGLPDFVAQHPPGATVFYLLVDRVWSGLDAAALATAVAASLGVLVVAGLGRDELGEAAVPWAAVCWLAAPLTVLYAATAADAMWAPVLAGGALAAHRGLERRSGR
jgi:methylthioxylose transferase